MNESNQNRLGEGGDERSEALFVVALRYLSGELELADAELFAKFEQSLGTDELAQLALVRAVQVNEAVGVVEADEVRGQAGAVAVRTELNRRVFVERRAWFVAIAASLLVAFSAAWYFSQIAPKNDESIARSMQVNREALAESWLSSDIEIAHDAELNSHIGMQDDDSEDSIAVGTDSNNENDEVDWRFIALEGIDSSLGGVQ